MQASLLALPLLATLVAATSQLTNTTTLTIPPYYGAGICSVGSVIGLDFDFVAASPIAAVFSGAVEAYTAILPANLTADATADLPSPLLEMSCFTLNQTITECKKTMSDLGRTLNPMSMCIFGKNTNATPVNATLTYTFYYEGDAPSGAVTTTAGPTGGTSDAATVAAPMVLAGAAILTSFLI